MCSNRSRNLAHQAWSFVSDSNSYVDSSQGLFGPDCVTRRDSLMALVQQEENHLERPIKAAILPSYMKEKENAYFKNRTMSVPIW